MTETELDSYAPVIQWRHAWILFLILTAGWLPAVLWPETIKKSASLYHFLDSTNPYFVPEHFFLLYFLAPLVVLSACFILLSPGLILSLALDRGKNFGLWILSSLALSMVIVSFMAGLVQSLIDVPVTGTAFVVVLFICSFLCFGVLVIQLKRGKELNWPFGRDGSNHTLFITLGIPLVVLLGMFPKFFWENLNGDGVHAFEAGRLLLFQPLPFWEPAAGAVANYPGITSMLSSFPISWFIRMFGEFEVCARLPFVLSLGCLFAAISAMVYQDRPARPRGIEPWLIGAAVLVFAVVLAFNATYNPYMADIALPSARDTLLITCLIGFYLYFLRKEYFWMSLFLILAFFLLPTVQMLVGLWLCFVFVVFRPRPWKPLLVASLVFGGCLILNSIFPDLLSAFGLPVPGEEFNVKAILHRFDLRSPDLRRLLFLIVPSGILPGLALLSWMKQDQVSRVLTLLTAGYFGFFAVQTHTALHHFIPVMIFPVIVFWRTDWWMRTSSRRFVLFATTMGCLVAFFLSLPPHFKPDNSGRIVGSTVEDLTGGYENHDAAAFGRARILASLFPATWDRRVPNRSYGGSELVWYFYAHHPQEPSPPKNYVLQFSNRIAPQDARLISKNEEVALYVRSMDIWKRHRALRPPVPAISKIYSVPRNTLFAGAPK